MAQTTVEQAILAKSSMNKFSRLFEERSIAAKAKAPAKAPEPENPLKESVAAITQEAPIEVAKTVQPEVTHAAANQNKLEPKRSVKSDLPVKLKPKTRLKSKTKSQRKSGQAPRKRGRPANGKRSDPNWYGRTFYIRKQTDEHLEDALRKLKRSGIEIDKSQLVDALLNAWANVELEQIEDFRIGEILEKPNED